MRLSSIFQPLDNLAARDKTSPAAVYYRNDRPFSHLDCSIFHIDARVIAGNSDIGSDGPVGVYGIGTGLCSLKPDLFLDGKDRVDREGGLYLLHGLYEHRNTGPVVKRLPGDTVVRELGELPVDRYGRPDLNAEFRDIILVFCPDIDEHVICFHAFLAFILVHHMRGLASNDPDPVTLCPMNDDALVIKGRCIPASKRDEPEKTLVIDIFDHEPDLVHMGGKHHLRLVAVLDCDKVSHGILGYLADMPLEFLLYQGKYAAFTARYTMGIGQFP